MDWLLFFITFILTFFVYIHICYHLKKVNDIDIYDMGYINKHNLEKVCMLRQPVTFLLEEELLEKFFNIQVLVDNYSNMLLDIYDRSQEKALPIPIPFKNVLRLLNQKKDYVSYNNGSFTEDTLTKSKLQKLDNYLSPPMTVYSHYDIWLGTEDRKLPMKSETYYREYLYITSGNIECLLITPNKEKKQLIMLSKSEALFVPPYWSYEITFKKNAFICVFRYDTALSIVTRLPQLVLDYIDKTNTTELSLKLKTSTIKQSDNSTNVSNTLSEESRSNLSSNTSPSAEPGAEPGAESSAEPGAEPGAEPSAGPGAGPGADSSNNAL